ncbi:MAG: hypothetical protein K8R68_11885 [Bacteroidales bacterium]|nr:hypothetical protein [Bacteroidales bacterium]
MIKDDYINIPPIEDLIRDAKSESLALKLLKEYLSNYSNEDELLAAIIPIGIKLREKIDTREALIPQEVSEGIINPNFDSMYNRYLRELLNYKVSLNYINIKLSNSDIDLVNLKKLNPDIGNIADFKKHTAISFEEDIKIKNKEFISSLKLNYSQKKPKDIVPMIYALFELDIISYNPGEINLTRLHKALEVMLGNIGVYDGFRQSVRLYFKTENIDFQNNIKNHKYFIQNLLNKI